MGLPLTQILLLARERLLDDPVHAIAADIGVQLCVDGCVVMGVPVGMDALIEGRLF